MVPYVLLKAAKPKKKYFRFSPTLKKINTDKLACLKVLYENIFYDLVLTKSQKMYLKIPMLVFQIQNVFSFSTATIVKTEKIFVIFVENIGEISW